MALRRYDSPRVQHRDAKELASGYSRRIRWLEISSICAFAALQGLHFARLARPTVEEPWLMLGALTAGFLFADFSSGVVHWFADTWGSPDLPLIGKAFLRPFREHHVDQKAITRHDWVETNGNNCLICVPPAVGALFIPLDSTWSVFLVAFLVWTMVWVMATNQFHKWAHVERPAPAVAFLQRWHLVLPPAHHAIHHSAPYTSNYCITTGWLNRPLAAIRFFRALEWVVTHVTGALPRADDLGRPAALRVAEAEQAVPADSRLLSTGEDPLAARER